MLWMGTLPTCTRSDVVVSIAGMPYKCPPAPFEYAFLIDEMLKKRSEAVHADIHAHL